MKKAAKSKEYKMQVMYHGDFDGHRYHGFLVKAKTPENAFEKLENYISDEIEVGIVCGSEIVNKFKKELHPKVINIK